MRSFAVSLLLLATLVPTDRVCAEATKPADDAVLKTANALYDGIRVETLPNGLKVYLKPIPGSPVVSTMVAYKVGACDEEIDQTGLAHYLEHLLFKGTKKLKPGDIDRITLQNGGMNNAYTTEDMTVYFFNFAADRWEQALDIEADRMRNTVIDEAHEFEQEKGAVIAELKRNEDTPWDLEQKKILVPLFGKGTPYGHPVIGEETHVRGATDKIITAFYDKWYHPNNASLVIVGGFDADKAMEKITKLFGPISNKELPPRKSSKEVKRAKPERVEFESKFEVPRMLMAYNTIRTGDPDYYPLEVLQAVLANGKTSRMYRKLVEGEQIAGDIGAGNYTGRLPGCFMVQVELLKDKDHKKAEQLALAEIARLAAEKISDAELDRVKRSMLASSVYERESVHALADSIARAVTTNDLDFLKQYLTRINAVTAEDVQRVARTYLDPEKRVVVWSLPKRGGQGTERVPEPKSAPQRVLPRQARNEKAPASADFSLKDTKRVTLPNGLTLLLFENHRLPIVVAQAYVPHVGLHDPSAKLGTAALMAQLLDEGTASHSGPEIAEMIENVGGTLTMGSSGGMIRVLTPDRALGLKLLFDCMQNPNFPDEAFQREKNRLLSEIDDEEQQPNSKARRVFREMAYGAHPLGRPGSGTRKTVETIQRQDIVDFHRRLFVPNNTFVAIVGDFDSNAVVEEIKKLTADWKQGEVQLPALPQVEKPKVFTQKVLSMPDAAQLHFYLGHIGIRRDDPDYYKLLVMDYILGTGPGFTDRLSSRLRDREGLAYTVTANISSSATDQPGLFSCYIGTEPKNFEHVKKTFLEEIQRIRTEAPSSDEVEDAKKYLLGSLPFQFTTNDRIAGQLLFIERHKLGNSYFEDYRNAVSKVTAKDILEVAKKHLDPQRMVLVAAGAVDEKGKPLPEPK